MILPPFVKHHISLLYLGALTKTHARKEASSTPLIPLSGSPENKHICPCASLQHITVE